LTYYKFVGNPNNIDYAIFRDLMTFNKRLIDWERERYLETHKSGGGVKPKGGPDESREDRAALEAKILAEEKYNNRDKKLQKKERDKKKQKLQPYKRHNRGRKNDEEEDEEY